MNGGGGGGRRVWGSDQDFRHPALDRHAGLCVILQLWWEGRCRELLARSEGYSAKLPWYRAGRVLREAGEIPIEEMLLTSCSNPHSCPWWRSELPCWKKTINPFCIVAAL
ncbi:Seizure Protein 6-like [Manis pentadactyla]|nr:Seizure Protein 6-like [Manis pentadactyla]